MSSPISNVTLSQSLMRGLACAALNPGLQSILVFDASHVALVAMASTLAQLLEAATGKEVKRVFLGISEIDDDLWGSLAICNDKDEHSIRWRHGLLTAPMDDPHLRLIVIPDLTKLSLASARACVMLVGADVAHLERHGQQELWRPQCYWLASCARTEVGSLSPHLLDRFALRLHWQDIGSGHVTRDAEWLRQVLKDAPYVEATDYPLPPQMIEQIKKAAQYRATLGEDAIKHVLEHIAPSEPATLRREVALARIAAALAQLENESRVKLAHVVDAARLIGLPAIEGPTSGQPSLDEDRIPSVQESEDLPIVQPVELLSPEIQPPSNDPMPPPPQEKQQRVLEDVYESDQLTEKDEILVSVHPYPEDKAPVAREVASLQIPLLRYSEARSNQGVVIGVERSDTLHDLAVVSTILAAAPFQPIRYDKLKQKQRQLADQLEQEQSDQVVLASLKQLQLIDQLLLAENQNNRPFLISRSDLRRYRRTPIAELMFLILLDYTSLRHCNWGEALLPYLVRAYMERASICIVQVGMAGAAHELRAEIVHARSILVPAIDQALVNAPGKATPLAHGFDLVLQTLRHALQHGRSAVQQVLLVGVSDGRGNVPLEDSRAGSITQPVFRKGVEDTLQVAQQLRDFNVVEKVLLNPQPKQYADLPLLLAEAMGAEVKEIPQPDGAEV